MNDSYIKHPFDISAKMEGYIWQLCEILRNVIQKFHARYVAQRLKRLGPGYSERASKHHNLLF